MSAASNMFPTTPPAVAKVTQNPVRSRDDLCQLTKHLVDPLLPYFSTGSARIRIGETGAHFDEVAAQFEGFARPLWGLVPLIAGGSAYPSIERWRVGLANGVDPQHPEYYGRVTDSDQRMVEMAAIGLALAFAGDTFWKPLSPEQKRNLNSWLLDINDHKMPAQNWRFFKVFVNLGLRIVGGEYSQKAIDEELDFIEGFYDQNGWPSDGLQSVKSQTDYYATSFAIPFYSLIYSKLARDWDPKRCEAYRERARMMSLDVVHLFAPDGSAIPFGRSLIYRFAVSAFWGAAAYADLDLPEPLTWGVVKGLLLRNIRWFTHREGIFFADGTLNIGYTYSNLIMAESYNSPQSPYWCLKAFLPLALPASHQFWTATEEPYPDVLLGETRVVRPWQQVCSHAAGHTFLLSSGQVARFPLRHSAQKYGKFAYSSAFGFSVPTGSSWIDQAGLDSTLGLSDDDKGEHWRTCRDRFNSTIDDEGIISSEWKPWHDVHVKTWLVPPNASSPAFHLRIHRVQSGRALRLADAGFALHSQQGAEAFYRLLPISSSTLPTGSTREPESDGYESPGEAVAVSASGAVGVVDIPLRDAPHTALRKAALQRNDPNSNIIHPRTIIPMLFHDVAAGSSDHWFASAIYGVPFTDGVVRPDWRKLWFERPSLAGFVGGKDA